MRIKENISDLRIGIGIVLILCVAIFLKFKNDSKISVVHDCKVNKLVVQNKLEGSQKSIQTEIRYLVITDKETFICESSVFNDKYNNSDIFFSLQEGKTYSFKVSGSGKSAMFDYRNILEVVK